MGLLAWLFGEKGKRIAKADNVEHWEEFLEQARESHSKPHDRYCTHLLQSWYISTAGNQLAKPSSGGKMGRFEAARSLGRLERVMSVVSVSDEAVTVRTGPYR